VCAKRYGFSVKTTTPKMAHECLSRHEIVIFLFILVAVKVVLNVYQKYSKVPE